MSSSKFKSRFVKSDLTISSQVTKLPSKGKIIRADRSDRVIASWPRKDLSGKLYARINMAGQAVTNPKFNGPSVICLIDCQPKLGQLIKITNINARSVSGIMINDS